MTNSQAASQTPAAIARRVYELANEAARREMAGEPERLIALDAHAEISALDLAGISRLMCRNNATATKLSAELDGLAVRGDFGMKSARWESRLWFALAPLAPEFIGQADPSGCSNACRDGLHYC